MDQAGAFLEDIVAHPEDDAPRLIFADWLDDQGGAANQARAEFIRAQMERHRLHPAQPRARALLRREEELLDRYRGEWTAAVQPLVRRCHFHRGFVEEVRLSAEQLLQHGPELVRLAPVQRLQLRGTAALPALLAQSPEHTRTLADVLARIKVLDLNRDYLGEAAGIALLRLPRLPRLDALHLVHNALAAGGIRVLADSPVLAGLTTLEFTGAHGHPGAAESLQTLLHSPHLAQLQHLSLAGARLGDRVARLLTHSPLLPQLGSLSVAHNQFSAAGLAELLASPAVAGLEALDVSSNPLGADGMRALREAPPGLRELNLSRTFQGNPDAIRLLAGNPLLGRLVSLDLSLDRIDDSGGRALCRGAEPACMLRLDLIYNPLTAAAQRELCGRFGKDVCLFKR
jgi:uncharacterized protein (TIGR02996 family)